MKLYLPLILGLLTSYLLDKYTKVSEEKMVAIEYSASFPEVLETGKVIDIINKFQIIYVDSLQVFKVPINYVSSRVTHKDNTTENTVVGESIDSISHKYYVFNPSNKTGISYEPGMNGRVVDVKIILKTQNIDEANFKIFGLSLDKPNEIIKDDLTGEIIVEKYASRTRKEGEADSLYRYYDKKLKLIPFSFSERLDTEKGSKLYRNSFIYNSSKNREGKVIPKREFNTSFKKITIDSVEISHIIRKYKADIVKQKTDIR